MMQENMCRTNWSVFFRFEIFQRYFIAKGNLIWYLKWSKHAKNISRPCSMAGIALISFWVVECFKKKKKMKHCEFCRNCNNTDPIHQESHMYYQLPVLWLNCLHRHLCILACFYLCTFVTLYLCIFVTLYLCVFVSLYLCTFVTLHHWLFDFIQLGRRVD